MQRNTGTIDRFIRGIAGAVAGYYGIVNISAWWGIALVIVGGVLLFTALFGW